MRRKKSTSGPELGKVLKLTVLFLALIIVWNLLGAQPEGTDLKHLGTAAKDAAGVTVKKAGDLADGLSDADLAKMKDKAQSTAKDAAKKAGDLAQKAGKEGKKLKGEATEKSAAGLITVSTIWHVEDTIKRLKDDPEWVSLDDIAPSTRKALLAIEDHDFYEHGAIDISSIMRAAVANLKAGEIAQGGSTLTQQMVKNVFLTSRQTFGRKAQEAIISYMVEKKHSKDEILEIYFNTTYFGNGAYGIAEASRSYFGKKPSRLSLGESCMIAAMPYAPSALNPYENPEGCAKRTALVLKEMQRYGYAGDKEAYAARQKGVTLKDGSHLDL